MLIHCNDLLSHTQTHTNILSLSLSHLAALTGEQAIVISGHLVPAHRTHLIQVFIVGVVHHFKLRGWKAQTHSSELFYDKASSYECILFATWQTSWKFLFHETGRLNTLQTCGQAHCSGEEKSLREIRAKQKSVVWCGGWWHTGQPSLSISLIFMSACKLVGEARALEWRL